MDNTTISNTSSFNGEEEDGYRHREVVSHWYFGLSVAVWFVSPMLAVPAILAFFDFYDRRWYLYLIAIPFGYALGILGIYIAIPLLDVSYNFVELLHPGRTKYYNFKDPDIMPCLKLFEQFGEAIPQFLIAVTFYSNNYPWLSSEDLALGIATMVLSCGSILFGVMKGIMSGIRCRDCLLDED